MTMLRHDVLMPLIKRGSSKHRTALSFAVLLAPLLGLASAPTQVSAVDAAGQPDVSTEAPGRPARGSMITAPPDFTLTPCIEVTDSVTRLYSAYFLRWPEIDGFNYWLGQYRSGARNLDLMSQFFSVSSEFQSRYGNLTNSQFVELVYFNVLGRGPDAAGRNYWVSRLDTGLSRGTMMIFFSESEEYVLATQTGIPSAGYFSWYPVGTRWECGWGYREIGRLGGGDYYDLGFWNSDSVDGPLEIDVHDLTYGWVSTSPGEVIVGGETVLYGNNTYSGLDAHRFYVGNNTAWFLVEFPTLMPTSRAGWLN